MALPEKLFRDALVADAGVSAIISNRAYFMHVPQAAQKPYVVITMVSNPRVNMISEADTIPAARIQCDVVTETLGDLGGARDAIRARMHVFSNSDIASCRLENDFTSYDAETEFPRAIMEFRLSYFES